MSARMYRQSIDVELLIEEIESRPELYNHKFKEFNDKNIKQQLWNEVFEAIIPHWEQMKNDDKQAAGKFVQHKWKNIKDSFRKELKLQKQTKTGDKKRKRTPYIYYDQLAFLVPIFHERQMIGNDDLEETYDEETSNAPPEEDFGAPVKTNDEESAESPEEDFGAPLEENAKEKKPTYEECLLEILQDSRKEDLDEDRYFLLSLLPSFKKLLPEQKMNVKIEYMRILQRRLFTDPFSNLPADK